MLYLTDERKPYYTQQIIGRQEKDITTLHKEIELYKKTWLMACRDIVELEKTNCDRQNWATAWQTAARTWRKVARHNQHKVNLIEKHIEMQRATIRDLHQTIGYLKAELKKHNV